MVTWRRGDAGYNAIFKGDLPNMTVGLLLFALVLTVLVWMLALGDRGAEEESPSSAALAACEGWERLRGDLEGEGVPRDEQVARVREVHALAERTELRAQVFEVIADRLAQDIDLGDHPEQADRQCAQLTGEQPG
jgi:hypothetical protein